MINYRYLKCKPLLLGLAFASLTLVGSAYAGAKIKIKIVNKTPHTLTRINHSYSGYDLDVKQEFPQKIYPYEEGVGHVYSTNRRIKAIFSVYAKYTLDNGAKGDCLIEAYRERKDKIPVSKWPWKEKSWKKSKVHASSGCLHEKIKHEINRKDSGKHHFVIKTTS